MSNIQIIPLETQDDFGLPALGCDVCNAEDTATIADLLEALDAFAAEKLADCRGCDGCCKERAPLIAADIPALAQLLPKSQFPAHEVIRAFGQLTIDRKGITDICFDRSADGCCCMLDRKGKFCTHHAQRAFVCRSHFCIPRSEALEQLRQEIVNEGENELTRMLLEEEKAGAAPITKKPLHKLVNAEDYENNTHKDKHSYDKLVLKDIISDDLWQSIKKEG